VTVFFLFLRKGRAKFQRRKHTTLDVFYVAPQGSLNLLSYATMKQLGLCIMDTEADNVGATQQPVILSVGTDTAASRKETSHSSSKKSGDKLSKTKATFRPNQNAALQANFDIQLLTSHLPVTFDKSLLGKKQKERFLT
jgi:hypothetical protein